jgi:hypothetical protein
MLDHGDRPAAPVMRRHSQPHKEKTMNGTLRKVDYFYAMVPDKPGEGARISAGLAAEGVNLLAFSAFPSGRKSQIDFVPEDAAALKRAARKLGLSLSPRKSGFLYQGQDRIGAMTDIFQKLADANVNITAVDAVTSGDRRFGAIFWVKPEAVAKASRVLGAKAAAAAPKQRSAEPAASRDEPAAEEAGGTGGGA